MLYSITKQNIVAVWVCMIQWKVPVVAIIFCVFQFLAMTCYCVSYIPEARYDVFFNSSLSTALSRMFNMQKQFLFYVP